MTLRKALKKAGDEGMVMRQWWALDNAILIADGNLIRNGKTTPGLWLQDLLATDWQVVPFAPFEETGHSGTYEEGYRDGCIATRPALLRPIAAQEPPPPEETANERTYEKGYEDGYQACRRDLGLAPTATTPTAEPHPAPLRP